jgi:ubiquinone/menaquinone biosynthesis C-methylase UbiE
VGKSRLAEFLVGAEGLALVRSFLADRPEEAAKRLDEIRRFASEAGEGMLGFELDAPEMDVASGYAAWAETYDQLPNPLIRVEEAAVCDSIAAVAPGRALDAACGTGRHAAHLAKRGFEVIGVDQSPEMLEKARARVPGIELRRGDLTNLPLDDESVDLVVCALALTHLPDLRCPISECARVVRRGGTVIVSDFHPLMMSLGGAALFVRADGCYGLVRSYRHDVGAYVSAARAAGLAIERCIEPAWTDAEAEILAGPLFALAPAAFRAAYVGLPGAIVWTLRR